MATEFINYQAQNIGTTTHHMIDGTAKVSNPTGLTGLDTGKAQIMVGCMVANIKTTSVEATVSIRNAATVTRLVKSVTIPAGDSVEVVQGKVVMEAGDEIEVSANSASALDCVVSVLKNA
tara:strand:- start:1201 stop:1560 length:360 start_codon:yes stop_codon:yes gene_type:complete